MDKLTTIEFLAQLPILASLQQDDLVTLAGYCRLKKAPRYHFIYVPDDPVEHLYFLVGGRVKTGTFTEEGKEVIKEILQPGALFSDVGLTGAGKYTDYAQALHDEVEYLSVSLSDFQQLMQSRTNLVLSCMAHLSKRLCRLEERLANMVSKDARERIIEFLVETAGREGRRIGFETLVKHHLTQADIASLTGTSRQTVTSVLNELKKANLIYFKRNSILIRDVAKLA